MPAAVDRTLQFRNELKRAYCEQHRPSNVQQQDGQATASGARTVEAKGTRKRTVDAKQGLRSEETVDDATLAALLAPPAWQPDPEHMDTFLAEAYRVAEHIESLREFLDSTRRAYLARTGMHGMHGGGSAGGRGGMTEAERDEVDRKAKEIIGGCAKRVSQLEELVKTSVQPAGVTLARRLLDSVGVAAGVEDEAREQQVRAHRGAIAWWLGKRLADVSSQQREQQEARLRREIERQRSSLRSSGSHLSVTGPHTNVSRSTEASRLGARSLEAHQVGSIGDAAATTSDADERIVDETLGLSEDQQRMLEQENQELASRLESTLDQVKAAERAILEIAELQNQLMAHVATQAKETERLYEEAVASTDRVREGNQQLLEAGRRSADTRKWILFFLIIASLILLFLDWYG